MPSSTELAVSSLTSRLIASHLSYSEEEARCVAEACLFTKCDEEGAETSDGTATRETASASTCAAALREYYPGLGEGESLAMVRECLGIEDELSDSSKGSGNESDADSGALNNSTDDVGDGDDLIGEGECELCERTIRLTRHHLIPKSTWPKMRNRLLRGADAISSGDEEWTRRYLGGATFPGLEGHEVTRDSVRRYLQRTCDICRPCHNAVHRLHGELELAEQYNTVEKLLTDEGIVKFCRWANKQRPGKYAL